MKAPRTKEEALARGWTGDNWLWCGACQKKGECPIVICTNHKDVPR